MAKNSNSRNQRNNPYLIEGWAVDFHRSKAGIAWRWRTELTLIAALTAGYFRLAATITALWALITFAWLGRLELAPLGRLEVAPARSAGVACRLELAPPLTRPFFSLLPETGPHRTVTVSPSGAT